MGYYVSLDGSLTFANETELQKFMNYIKNDDSNASDIKAYLKDKLNIRLNGRSKLDYDIYETGLRYSDQDYELAEMLLKADVDAEMTLYSVGEDNNNQMLVYKNKTITTEEMVYVSQISAKDIFESLTSEQKTELLKLLSEENAS